MKKRQRPKPERPLAAVVFFGLALAACTAVAEPSTTSSSVHPGSTTTATSEPDRCRDRFCVVYRIRAEASWSDGTPVTADDFIHTYMLQTTDEGYALITGFEAWDDKTVLFAFSEPYGPWRALFGVVVPAHVSDPLSVSAGPYVLDEMEESVRLVRNSEYWGDFGDVERVHMIPETSVRDGLSRLDSGQLDVLFPPTLDWVLAELDRMTHVNRITASGPTWEQIAFNFDNPLLARRWLREAISLAIDRELILDATVRLVAPDEGALDSAIWPVSAALYEPVFPDGFSPDRAMQILAGQGCVQDDDGVQVCDGARLEFTFATTIGDPWRRAHYEIIRDQLADIGVELTGVFLAPADLFAADFFFGGHADWDMIAFPWRFSERVHLGNTRFTCAGTAPSGFGALNVNRFCDDALDTLVTASETEIHLRGQRDLYREIDRRYLTEFAVIPLYQRPVTVAWNAAIDGPAVNMSTSTHLWGISSWTGVDELRIGIDSIPGRLDPLSPGDAALVLAPVSAGAFSVDPSLRFTPELIESAETIVRTP